MRNAWPQIVAGFVVGILVGAAGSFSARAHFRARMAQDPVKHLLELFSRKLDLTAEQKTKVAAILEVQHPKMEALRAEVRPKFEAIHNETREEIRKVLDPEQQKKLDILDAKLTARWKK